MPFARIDQHEVYLVTTSDQRMFRCHVEEVGRERQKRWVFIGADGTAHIGPPWFPLAHEGELHDLVEEWWDLKKGLGQA